MYFLRTTLISTLWLKLACRESKISITEADNLVSDYIIKYSNDKGKRYLAGNSVHQDRLFIDNYMPSTRTEILRGRWTFQFTTQNTTKVVSIGGRYNRMAKEIREVARKIKELDPKDPFRTDCSARLLEKVYMLGLISTKWDLGLCDKVTASCFCRRRLPVVMVRNKMAENLKAATMFIEQGHVRVGPELVKDPAFLVSRNLEDFITWVDTSAIRKHVLKYNEEFDDFDVL